MPLSVGHIYSPPPEEGAMVTYAQLQTESWWNREVQPSALVALGQRLYKAYGRPANSVGIKGDNRHLNGAHRSQEWILKSRWCTNRSYTVQSGLTATQARYLCGLDFNPGSTQRMIEICSRLDKAVRAGELEQVREWYGNDDGDKRVDGFDNVRNRVASSHASHLWHLHMTMDRQLVNDTAAMQAVGDVLLGKTPAGVDVLMPVPSGSPLLRVGATGADVRDLQAALNQAIRAGLATDGDFGPATEAAVKAFQRAVGLTADGIYGPATAGALRQALEDDMGVEFGDRVDMYDEAGKKRWWAGSVIGKDSISVHQAFMYGAMTPFYLRTEVLPRLKAAEKRDEAILAAIKGVDTEAILARIDQRAAEDAARDAALVQLLEQHADGTLDADAVVRRLGELLTAAADGDDGS